MIRRGLPLAVIGMVSFGYGRFSTSMNGTDPVHAMLSVYLTVYGITPVLVVLAVVDALSSGRSMVFVRSGSILRWWWQRAATGSTWGLQAALAALTGLLLARVGLPVVGVGVVIVKAAVLTIELAGLAVIAFGIVNLTVVAGRALAAASAVGIWMIVLIASRGARPLAVWGDPSVLARSPSTLIHLVWPVLLLTVVAVLLDLQRQGRVMFLVRPAMAYAVVAGGCTIAQSFAGRTVVQADGTIDRFFDPFPDVLGGVAAGTDLRQLLFVTIIHVGYAAAFAVHLATHRDGAEHAELIRLGSVRRWMTHMTWPWLAAAPLVPIAGVVCASASSLINHVPLPSPTDIASVAAAATAQMIVYLLAVLVVHQIHPSTTAVVVFLTVLVAASFLRILGIPVPGVAMNGAVLADRSASLLTTVVPLGAFVLLLIIITAVVGRFVHPDRRITQ